MPREKVEVVEVGLRDGLQILERVVPTGDKIAWLEAEHTAGVRRFEAASFVPPKLMPQMADATEVVAAAKRLPGVVVTALVPNQK
jgi:hydroxymethylglutaryl-CoA lyase